jgi:hypothetical protein
MLVPDERVGAGLKRHRQHAAHEAVPWPRFQLAINTLVDSYEQGRFVRPELELVCCCHSMRISAGCDQKAGIETMRLFAIVFLVGMSIRREFGILITGVTQSVASISHRHQS